MLNRNPESRISSLSMFDSSKFIKLEEMDGYFLYLQRSENKLYLTNNVYLEKNTSILATASYAESEEAEIALLSDIQADNRNNKKILFELVKKHLSHHRADLFYSEADMDLSIAAETKKCKYEDNVMIRQPLKTRLNPSDFLEKQGYVIIHDKKELLNKIPEIKNFLLKHSIMNPAHLSEERLAKRIMELSFTCVIMNPNNECFAYGSYISNGKACYGDDFCIHTDFRGKGLGVAVSARLASYLPINQMLYLITAYEGPTQKQAKTLYEKSGYETYEKNPTLKSMVAVFDIEQKKTSITCKL